VIIIQRHLTYHSVIVEKLSLLGNVGHFGKKRWAYIILKQNSHRTISAKSFLFV